LLFRKSLNNNGFFPIMADIAWEQLSTNLMLITDIYKSIFPFVRLGMSDDMPGWIDFFQYCRVGICFVANTKKHALIDKSQV